MTITRNDALCEDVCGSRRDAADRKGGGDDPTACRCDDDTTLRPLNLHLQPASHPECRYSNRYRKGLMNVIGGLSSTAHEEIFRMVTESGVNHTKNKHGIHVNLSLVDDHVIGRISAFVDYCVDKDRELQEYTEKLQEYRLHRRYDYESIDNNNVSHEDKGGGGDRHDTPASAYISPAHSHLPSSSNSNVAQRADTAAAALGTDDTRCPQLPPGTVTVMATPMTATSVRQEHGCSTVHTRADSPPTTDSGHRRLAAASKFNVAKKRFAKKNVSTTNDRNASGTTIAGEGNGELLVEEPYLLHSRGRS